MRKVLILLGLFFPLVTSADGGIFPPPDKIVYETSQQAVIFYEDGKETLIISTSFRGEAKDFGWVIPVPERPKVSKASEELFRSLEDSTKVVEDIYQSLTLEEAFRLGKAPSSVHIIETKKIDYYDITILQAEDKEALAKWLSKHNYHFPEKAGYLLDSYIQNKWYFVAVKIDTESVWPGLEKQMREGHLVPLKLEFASQRPFYPLKLTSVTQFLEKKDIRSDSSSRRIIPFPYYRPEKVGLVIYIFTPERKQTLPGFKTEYAGWMKQETIENLAFDEQGHSWLKPKREKYFLTKLSRWMSLSEMTEDLYFRNASDNNLVNALPLEGPETTYFWLVVALGGIFTLIILGVFFRYSFKESS